jgi:hypothetical protein
MNSHNRQLRDPRSDWDGASEASSERVPTDSEESGHPWSELERSQASDQSYTQSANNAQPPQRLDSHSGSSRGSESAFSESAFDAQRSANASPINSSAPLEYDRPPDFAPSFLNEKLEEKAEHLDKGLCFRCHLMGHMSRNCPQKNDIQSDRSRLSGISSHPRETSIARSVGRV